MDSWMKRGFLKASPLSKDLGSGSKPSSDKPQSKGGSVPRSLAEGDIKTKKLPLINAPSNKPQSMLKIPSIPPNVIKTIPGAGSGPSEIKGLDIVHLPYDRSTTNEPITSCLLYPGAKEGILAIPGFPGAYRPSLRVNYRIDDAPGAGKGMFAQKDLDVGDLILRERPVCLAPKVISGVGNLTGYEILELLVLQLSEEDYGNYNTLTNCKDNYSPAVGIMFTNAFNARALPGIYDGPYFGVSLDMSRANHSCSPNAVDNWILKDMVYELRALRPIKSGEQIFVSYLNLSTKLLQRETRREELQRKYKFKCQCSSCALPYAELSVSNFRRSALRVAIDRSNEQDDDAMLIAWTNDLSLSDDYPIAISMTVLEVMDAEGLVEEDVWKLHYPRLTKAYCALKDAKNAKLWAKRTAKLLLTAHSDDLGWNQVAESPESTDWWGRRKRN